MLNAGVRNPKHSLVFLLQLAAFFYPQSLHLKRTLDGGDLQSTIELDSTAGVDPALKIRRGK